MRAAWPILIALLPAFAHGQPSRPDPASTPGALNPAVTQENIANTICLSGWTRTVRPPVAFTSPLKRRQIAAAGFPDRQMADYQEDHLVPLELGGVPADVRNLWPEPRKPADGWTSNRKDGLEGALHRLVCSAQIPLADAQHAFMQDWTVAYGQYVRGGRRLVVASAPLAEPGRPGAEYYRSVDGAMVHRPTKEGRVD